MDAHTRDYLRHEISKRKLASLNSKRHVQYELEMKQLLGDALDPEDRAMLMILDGRFNAEITTETGLNKHRIAVLRKKCGNPNVSKKVGVRIDDEIRQQIMDMLRQNPDISTGEVERMTGVNARTVRRWKQALAKSSLT